jgi:hypothetical protein
MQKRKEFSLKSSRLCGFFSNICKCINLIFMRTSMLLVYFVFIQATGIFGSDEY